MLVSLWVRSISRRLSAIALGAITALMILGPQARAQNPGPIEIDVIVPATGFLAQLGSSLQGSLQGIEAEVNSHGGIRGRDVHFAFFDDASSPQNTVQLANQIIAKNPAVFFEGGPLAACNAAQALLKSTGPVMYCLSPALRAAPGSYVFSTSIDTFDLYAALFRYFRTHGITRLAVLNPTDASGAETDKDIHQLADMPENRSVSLVAYEHFNNNDLSVSAQVANIEAARPQAIWLLASGTAFGLGLRTLKDAGNQVPVATSNSNMTMRQMDAFRSTLPQSLLFPAPLWVSRDTLPAGPLKAAVDRFISTNNAAHVPNDIASSLAYDPALIVIGALQKLGPTATATQIHDYIENLRNFPGSSGNYDFRASPQRGLTINDVVIARWDPDHTAFIGVSGAGGGSR